MPDGALFRSYTFHGQHNLDGNDFSSVNWQSGPGLQVLALALLCAATVLVGRLQASSPSESRDWHVFRVAHSGTA